MDQKVYRIPMIHCIVACLASLILGIGIGVTLAKIGMVKTNNYTSPSITPVVTLKQTPTPTKIINPEDLISVTLYFNNDNFNPQVQDCTAVFPVTRMIPKTSTPLQAAAELLFAGPNEEEKAFGYNSIFSKDTARMLKSVNLKNGVVYLDFNQSGLLAAVRAGANSSCGGAQFGASIQKTLLGVSGVKTVLFKNFSLEGDKTAFQNMMQ